MAQQQPVELRQHGKRSIQIVRTERAPLIDGLLDEEVWTNVPVANGFLQRDPNEGMPATEETEVRLLYDEQNLYLGIRCFDSHPNEVLATELRRDNLFDNDDSFALLLDTFHDHRNGFLFRINPRGAQYDALITEEGRDINANWDEKWTVETRIDEEGWSAEIRIPLKSLRFSTSGENGSLGIDFERVIRRKNEFTHWNNSSRGFRFEQLSQAGHLTGLEDIGVGFRVRVKPYINTRLSRRGGDDRNTNLLGDVGLEILKYRVNAALTLDLTANTDFAQTEVDDQIINFERVPTFFPEKRDFFLEGGGTFQFGNVEGELSPQIRLYHSRRIGLSQGGMAVPLLVGAKLVGKIGERFTVGFLEVQTDDHQGRPADNFGIFRLKRDLFSRSSVGLFLSNRQAEGGDYNRLIGIDQNLVFFEHLTITGTLAKSSSDWVDYKQWFGTFKGEWQDDLLRVGLDYSRVEENFASDIGFINRLGVRKISPRIIISPRPKISFIRQFQFGFWYDNYGRLEGTGLQSEQYHTILTTNFESGSQFRLPPHRQTEDLQRPLRLPGGLVVPPGRYTWWLYPMTYQLNPARRLSGSFQWFFEPGYYGSGRRDRWNFNPVVKFSSNFSAEIRYSINRIRLTEGKPIYFHQMNNRFNVAFSRKWLTSVLVQYNSTNDLFGINLRLNYIYRPGDDLFIVYNDFRNTQGLTTEVDRTFTVKFTHSFDF